MSHFLYRPHIWNGEVVITTDFILQSTTVIGDDGLATGLPIDLLNNHISMGYSDDAMIVPMLFRFAGDDAVFAAPAIGLLDRDVYNYSPVAAWRSIRVSISRQALLQQDKNASADPVWVVGGKTENVSPVETGATQPSKRSAILHALSAPQAVSAKNTNCLLTLNRTPDISHNCVVKQMDQETANG